MSADFDAEHQERISKIIAERKQQKAKEKEEEELLKEKERREQGKTHQKTLRQMEELKEQKEREKEEKEKQADLLYQKKLKEQIKQEREERLKQSQQGVTDQTTAVPSPTVDTPETKKNLGDSPTLRVRLLNGESVVEIFEATATLGEVMRALNEKYKVTANYNFRITFPNKVFTTADEDKTLLQLNLVPNATLLMTQSEHAGQQQATTQNTTAPVPSYIQMTADYLLSWVYWFIGVTPAVAQPTAPPSSHGPTRGKVNHVQSVNEYNQLKNTNDLVIVDISAVWCGPCKKIAPYFEELARNNPSVVFVHVDLDHFKHTISDLSGVHSVPTFLFFKNKRLVTEIKGANPQKLLQTMNSYK